MKIYNQQTKEFEEKEYVEKSDTGWAQLLKGIKYRRCNGIVTIRFFPEFASVAITQPWQCIATLPEECWPNETIFFNGCTNDMPTATVGIMVSEIGTICLLAPISATTSLVASITYQL